MYLFALRMKAEFHCTFFLLPNIRICSTKNHTVMWPCRQSGHKVQRFNLSIKWSLLLAPRPGRLTPGKKPSVTHNRSGRRQTERFQPPLSFKQLRVVKTVLSVMHLILGAVNTVFVVIYCYEILIKLESSRHIFDKTQISNFIKIRPAEAELYQRTEGRADMTKLIVAFLEFAEASKTLLHWSFLRFFVSCYLTLSKQQQSWRNQPTSYCTVRRRW
jgi:hypothetical protein